MNNQRFLIEMGNRIAQRRKEAQLTQEQLADKMGLSLQSISCIELGKKAIRPENLANLCFHLGVTADYILSGKRDSAQMSGLLAELATLSPEEYGAIEKIVALLCSKK